MQVGCDGSAFWPMVGVGFEGSLRKKVLETDVTGALHTFRRVYAWVSELIALAPASPTTNSSTTHTGPSRGPSREHALQPAAPIALPQDQALATLTRPSSERAAAVRRLFAACCSSPSSSTGALLGPGHASSI